MGSSLMQDFKRQASFFLREKIKTARLVLTDVTPSQLLTEEVTNGDSLGVDSHAMRIISRAAFEVDDYERIVHILHHRLSKFERWNWRASYKALVLVEHLLTHGPQRIAEEFESDEDTIRDMATFHYVDNKGFDWGLSVKNKSERVVNLLQDSSYLKEERARARKVMVGIKGFGSLNNDESSSEDEVHQRTIFRSKSLFFGVHHHHHHNHDHDHDATVRTNLLGSNDNMKWCSHSYTTHEYAMEEDHPFWDKEHQTRASLLSSV